MASHRDTYLPPDGQSDTALQDNLDREFANPASSLPSIRRKRSGRISKFNKKCCVQDREWLRSKVLFALAVCEENKQVKLSVLKDLVEELK